MSTKTITLGAGCFWCIETSYRRLRGVKGAISGYSGGDVENPTYEMVKLGIWLSIFHMATKLTYFGGHIASKLS